MDMVQVKRKQVNIKRRDLCPWDYGSSYTPPPGLPAWTIYCGAAIWALNDYY